MHSQRLTTNVIPQSVSTLERKIKCQFTHLKETTGKMFEQYDNDNDQLHHKLRELESSIQDLQKNRKPTSVARALFHDNSTDNESVQPNRIGSSNNFLNDHPCNYFTSQGTTLHKGPNMEYLLKNVLMTCADQDQILEFYIKLRLAVAKGGIHLVPIKAITKVNSIAQINPHNTHCKKIFNWSLNLDLQNFYNRTIVS